MSYQSAIVGLCSLAICLLVPPLAWHSQTKNIPAIILIVWLLIMNLTCIVNAAIWSDVDFMNRWDGKGWCDIVIKLQVGANIGISCAVTNIVYNLHSILKANSVLLDSDSWVKILKDLTISLLTPIIVMALSYLLQVFRYGIARYNGCQNLLSPTWVTTVLYTMWMLIWSFIGAVYATLVLYVFYRKRKDVRDILHCTNSGLDLKRFARLLIFCFVIILVMFPFSLYSFVQDLEQVGGKYSFKGTHSEVFWNTIIKFDAGKPVYNIWLYVLMSYIVFLIFGLGTDALNMYARAMRRAKLGFIIDTIERYVQRNRENRLGKLLGSMSDRSTFQNSTCSDDSEIQSGWGTFSPQANTPTSPNNFIVDYRMPSDTYRKRNNEWTHESIDLESNGFYRDVGNSTERFAPYLRGDIGTDDEISLDGFSRITFHENKGFEDNEGSSEKKSFTPASSPLNDASTRTGDFNDY